VTASTLFTVLMEESRSMMRDSSIRTPLLVTGADA